jgi:prepilin-type N-terminal cleavage/methylation domain-containing protein
MPQQTDQRGFTLIELVTTVILVGIIGAFTGFFLFTGIKGFITSKTASESALKAEIALDRISAELRFIESLTSAPVQDVSLEYKSRDLPGTRRISFESGAGTISITVNGASHVLLDNVQTFRLRWTPTRDMNDSGDGQEEIAGISVGFTLRDLGTPFATQVYPRAMLPKP